MYRLKSITPRNLGLLNPKVAERMIENVTNQTALAIQADFNVTTQTWRRRPAFLVKRTKTGAKIYTTNLIYKFVSGGTRVRYATMTPGFIPKTRAMQIRSWVGRGGLMYVSKRRPRKGIKARKFPEAIGEKWMKELPAQFERAIQTEINAAS